MKTKRIQKKKKVDSLVSNKPFFRRLPDGSYVIPIRQIMTRRGTASVLRAASNIRVFFDDRVQEEEKKFVTKKTRTELWQKYLLLAKRGWLPFKFLSFSLAVVIASAPLLLAFEGHVLNVTATIIQLDPPVILPPGGTYFGPLDINITDDDPDVTDIYYTVTPGSDPNTAPDPVCGVSAGGGKPRGPINLSSDSVVKAIGCDGTTPAAHHSMITIEIYHFVSPFGTIEGHKYHDLDKSGTLTPGDVPIEGWSITVSSGVSTSTTVTDENGYYVFNDLDPDTYTVEENLPAGWQNISPADYIISVAAGEIKTANFFNFDTGFACVPTEILFPANLAVQVGSTTPSLGNNDVTIASNVDINGDVRSNDEIEQIGGGTNRDIFGDAMYVTSIDSGIVVSGSTSTVASVPLPDIQVGIWQERARDGGTVNGSFVFPNGTTGIQMGPTEVLGDVTFGGSNSVVISGPIYIHGNLTIGSNTTITQDSGFGNQFATIIVDGIVNISSNISFVGAGATGTFLLVSTHSAVSGTGAAILTNSNNSDLGDVVLYALNGDVHIDSNRTILAVFAAHGTGDDSDNNGAIRFDSNVVVNYRTLPDTISCGPRQPFESTEHVLINEFMPNPGGSDQGVAGGALDGEWVELFNPTGSPIDVSGYVLYDSVNTNDLPITIGNTNTGGTVVPSSGFLVVYRNGDTNFELNNSGGDTVRLFNGPIGGGGALVDSHAYTADAPDNKSFARIPDGAANWIDPDATPGEPNDFFIVPLDENTTSLLSPKKKPAMVMPYVEREEPRENDEERKETSVSSETFVPDSESSTETVAPTEEIEIEVSTSTEETASSTPIVTTEEAIVSTDNSNVSTTTEETEITAEETDTSGDEQNDADTPTDSQPESLVETENEEATLPEEDVPPPSISTEEIPSGPDGGDETENQEELETVTDNLSE